ncbi:MAG: sugar phosphate isomerase/epimerase [Candidatus Latescibacterota bacterium]|nr:MAG: sugar phosphate isomerase/epimerase [Candidatus Latescibacterota bacterium]
MKLAFTTLGCPEWDMDTILSKAVEYGFDGVDFRGYLGTLELFKLPEFTTQAKKTARRFADANLEVSCFSSSARIFCETDSEKAGHLEEIRAYARMCEAFGTRLIRIFGGAIGDTPRAQAIEMAGKNLKAMAAIAEDYGVVLLLETHDSWTDCAHLKALMEFVDSDSVGILWDIHHPYRSAGESPSETWQTLGKWIRYTHWKDSFPRGADYQLCLIGGGDLPLEEIFRVLKQGGYSGYLTLEWEKKWHPEIEEPEKAFPGFVRFMRGLISTHEGQ